MGIMTSEETRRWTFSSTMIISAYSAESSHLGIWGPALNGCVLQSDSLGVMFSLWTRLNETGNQETGSRRSVTSHKGGASCAGPEPCSSSLGRVGCRSRPGRLPIHPALQAPALVRVWHVTGSHPQYFRAQRLWVTAVKVAFNNGNSCFKLCLVSSRFLTYCMKCSLWGTPTEWAVALNSDERGQQEPPRRGQRLVVLGVFASSPKGRSTQFERL